MTMGVVAEAAFGAQAALRAKDKASPDSRCQPLTVLMSRQQEMGAIRRVEVADKYLPAVQLNAGVDPGDEPGDVGQPERPCAAIGHGGIQRRLPAYHVVGVKGEHRSVVQDEHAERWPLALSRHLGPLGHPDAAYRAVARLGVVEVPVLAVHTHHDRRWRFRDTQVFLIWR